MNTTNSEEIYYQQQIQKTNKWPTNSEETNKFRRNGQQIQKKFITRNTVMLLSKCETFAAQVAYAWVSELFSNWGEQVHVKKTRKFLWFELATVTLQALKYDVINFCQHS